MKSYLSTSIVPTPTWDGVGMLVPNSCWSYRTLTILPSIPSAVRGSQLKVFSLNFKGLLSDAHHRFTAEVYDWGFIRFGESHKLFQPQLGHNRPTIEEGSAVVSVYVRVLDDPTGVLWRNLAK